MKNQSNILTIITYGILLTSVSILMNDYRDFNFQEFEKFTTWAKTAEKDTPWYLKEQAIQWSFYAIHIAIFFWRAYLIYAFTYFISILKEIEKGNYFSDKIISSFKKIGYIFIYYTLNMFIFHSLLSVIDGSSFDFFEELKADFTFLIPCGLGFYLLADIFTKAKTLKDENDLTI